MSTINFHTIEPALRSGVPEDCKITFDDVEVSLDGIQYEIEVSTEVSVDGEQADYSGNYAEIELRGDRTKDVRMPLSDVVVGIEDAGLENELLGALLRGMEEEDFIHLLHAIASMQMSQADDVFAQARDAEQSAVCGNNSEEVVAAQAHLDECRTKRLYWQRVHSAVTGPVPLPEPEPETETESDGDAPDPGVSMTATELVEEAMDQQSIAQERADDAAPDTVLTPDDLSSARYLAMAMIHNDHQRPLLIGLLVEAGYAVGKKVS